MLAVTLMHLKVKEPSTNNVLYTLKPFITIADPKFTKKQNSKALTEAYKIAKVKTSILSAQSQLSPRDGHKLEQLQ